MSYYIAPTTITVEDKITFDILNYYFVVSSIGDGSSVKSYFSSNFPIVTTRQVVQIGEPASFRSSIDQYRRINVSVSFPLEAGYFHIQSLLFLPISIHFQAYSKPIIHSYIMVEFLGNDPVFIKRGEIRLKQKGSLKQTYASIVSLLSSIQTSSVLNPITIDDFITIFDNSPISSSYVQKEEVNIPGTDVVLNLKSSVPYMIVEHPAPYWNVFRNTYVQIFYWMWLVVIVMSPFIDSIYHYGFVETSKHNLLKPSLKTKLD